jgi:hypothetical protein
MEDKMNHKSKPPAVKGRIAQVDICPSEAGFVLSLGPVSLWLEPGVAEDIIETLSQALSLAAGRPAADGRELGPSPVVAVADLGRKSN